MLKKGKCCTKYALGFNESNFTVLSHSNILICEDVLAENEIKFLKSEGITVSTWRIQTPGRDGALLGVVALHLCVFVTLRDLVVTVLGK